MYRGRQGCQEQGTAGGEAGARSHSTLPYTERGILPVGCEQPMEGFQAGEYCDGFNSPRRRITNGNPNEKPLYHVLLPIPVLIT